MSTTAMTATMASTFASTMAATMAGSKAHQAMEATNSIAMNARQNGSHPGPLPAHEQGRADFHALIAALLLHPQPDLVQALAQAPPLAAMEEDFAGLDPTPTATSQEHHPHPPGSDTGHTGHTALAPAWQALVRTARLCGPQAVLREHAALFVAVGAPYIDPYASQYRAGFLMDQTLARLRADLRALGLERRRDAAHTEDHLGALCETMRLLIVLQPLAVQRSFFCGHLLPWAGECLADIRQAEGAFFYAALADFAQAFFACEQQAFELLADPDMEPVDDHPEIATAAQP